MDAYEFVEGFDSFRFPISLPDVEPALGLMNNFPGLNPTATVMENSSLGMFGFSNVGFLPQLPELPVPYNPDGTSVYLPMNSPPLVSEVQPPVTAVREDSWESERSQMLALEDSASMIAESKSKKSGSNKGKRKKCSRKNKHEHEVVVRAKRGQATDRHSVSERVRREKINEKMRCLQGLVPACYKAMGMAVMLDEIIKYVRSLQNQVEFLSMKLSVASAVYDFNLDQLDDAVAMMPQLLPSVRDEDDAREVDRLIGGRYEGFASLQPTMPF